MKNKKLNFGCGRDIKPKNDGWINVDIQKANGIDKSFDFDKFPYPFKDDEFDYVFADNVFEHLENPIKSAEELWRVSKKGGIIEITVPYYKSKWAWGDITHKNFFSELSVRDLFREKDYFYRKKKKFEILEINLKPSKPLNYIPDILRKILNRCLNNIYSEIKVKARILK